MAHWRKIVVAGKPYSWTFGRTDIIIRHDNRVVHKVPQHTVAGVSVDAWERACRKRYGSITPKDIARVIING